MTTKQFETMGTMYARIVSIETLKSKEIRVELKPLTPKLYKKESCIIGLRGAINTEYLTSNDGVIFRNGKRWN